jgi:hypothetical protein
MSLIIIAAIILIPQIGYTSSSDLAPEQNYIGSDVVPEIEVVATRLISDSMDSIGAMPGIIVYGERPEVAENLYIQQTLNRNKLIVSLSDIFGKYALFSLAAIFMITLSIVAVSKAHMMAHININQRQSTSAVHRYYLQHRDDIEREMQRYLAHLIGNSK